MLKLGDGHLLRSRSRRTNGAGDVRRQGTIGCKCHPKEHRVQRGVRQRGRIEQRGDAPSWVSTVGKVRARAWLGVWLGLERSHT